MADVSQGDWVGFDLAPAKRNGQDAATKRGESSLPAHMLIGNELWFCRLRWQIVAVLTIFGLLSHVDGFYAKFGLRDGLIWPFVIAAILTIANIAFLRHARNIEKDHSARKNLWTQIAFDLVMLTAVVHLVGSLETFVAFAYLFHIALACLFFSRAQSLLVTALSSFLYIACVSLEWIGLVPVGGIFLDGEIRLRMMLPGSQVAINVGSAVVIWFIVWSMTSRLSSMVRQRDRRLEDTNARLIKIQEEKRAHMLRTTHELKAPFAAIDANVQILQGGYCGELPDQAVEVLAKIAARSRRLAVEIQEMLQLANISSETESKIEKRPVDLGRIIESCVEQIRQIAERRGIEIETELDSVTALGDEDHFKMLFSNLISNAVFYSREGGKVSVELSTRNDSGITAEIEDNGIGIPAEKLPYIFDEYYRADEAVSHHQESTGLGLAIVKRLAEIHDITIRVESRKDVGTRFTLYFSSVHEGNLSEEGGD